MGRPRSSTTQTGQPISIRLSRATDQLVTAEARRTRRSRSAVVQAFTEETARSRRFPGIAFRGDDARRRAWVIGSGLDVWEIAHMLEDFGGRSHLEALLRESGITERHARIAAAYRDAFPDEIDEAVEDNRRRAEDRAALYPFVALEPGPR